MAGMEDKEDDDFIKCSICFEVFKTPKYLPCLHTFCECCLSAYISSSAKTENCTKCLTKSIACPVCRTEVAAPNPSMCSDEWASKFPVNHLMVTIMDKNKLRNKTKTCDPCAHRNVDKAAIAWCSDCGEALCEGCDEFHRSMKISRDHKIVKIEEMTKGQPFVATHVYCDEHTEKKIETFCYDHNKPCCLTCMTIYHRKCDHVTTLEEAANEIRKNQELSECTEQMNNIQSKFDEIFLATEGNIKDLNSQRDEIDREMGALRVEINKHLEHLEQLLKDEFSCLHREYVDEMRKRATVFDNKRKLISNSQKMLEMCKRHATDVQVFLEMKKQQRRQNELQQFLNNQIPEIKRVDFELNVEEDILWITSSLQSLGSVTAKTSSYPEETFLRKPISQTAMPAFLRSYKTEEILTFSVKNSDQFSHWHGIVFLSNGKILISDWTSKTLILFDNEGKPLGEILLSGQPYDVTLINDSELAVSRRGERVIDIVDIDKKVVTRQIKLQHMCFGITTVDNKLAVACDTSIVVLTLEGQTVREIPVSSGVYCIATGSNGTLCYTNFARGTVNCISLDGLSIFSYGDNDMKGTLGVTTDNDGNVYVAGRESSGVYQLSPNGTLMKTILSKESGVENPWALQIDKEPNRLLVTHSGSKVTLYKLMAMYDYF